MSRNPIERLKRQIRRGSSTSTNDSDISTQSEFVPKKSQFAVKTQESVLAILSKVLQNEKYFSIISWTNSGRAFNIKDKAKFIKDVLPLIYGHQNFPSFVRQMKGEGFKLLKRKEGLSFYMKGFQKNKPYKDLAFDADEEDCYSSSSDIENSFIEQIREDTNLQNNNINKQRGLQMDAYSSNFKVSQYGINHKSNSQQFSHYESLIKDLEKRSEEMEQNMKAFEDQVESSLYKHHQNNRQYQLSSNKDLQIKLHILETATNLFSMKDLPSQEMNLKISKCNQKFQQDTLSQKASKDLQKESNPSRRLIEDFKMSEAEMQQQKQLSLVNQNDQLHNQVLNLSNNLIFQLSNYMKEKGLNENPQVNQIINQVASRKDLIQKDFYHQSSDSEGDSYSYELINLQKKSDPKFEKLKRGHYTTQQNTCIHSNEESQTIDSSFVQEDVLMQPPAQSSPFNLYELNNPFTDQKPDDQIFDQGFNWSMNNMTCNQQNYFGPQVEEENIVDFDNILQKGSQSVDGLNNNQQDPSQIYYPSNNNNCGRINCDDNEGSSYHLSYPFESDRQREKFEQSQFYSNFFNQSPLNYYSMQ